MILGFKWLLRGGSRRPTRSALWLASTLFLSASPAFAEDAETRTAARDLATQGAEAFDQGRFADASDLFRRAHELVPAPSIALLQARSLVKLGLLLEAIDIYEQTAHVKLSEDAPGAYVHAVETARGETEELRKRLPRLKLSLVGVADNDEARVTIDERPTPAALLGVERPVNPGRHRIAVRVAGRVRAQREVSLVESETYQIELHVETNEPRESSRAASWTAPARVGSSAPPSTRQTVAYVALGTGILGIGLGTYTGLVALHHQSELDAVCRPGCPASSARDLDAFRGNRTVSWLSYGVGIAAATAGVVLLTLRDSGHEQLAIRAFPAGLQLGGAL